MHSSCNMEGKCWSFNFAGEHFFSSSDLQICYSKAPILFILILVGDFFYFIFAENG